jgi:hypothetical protein
MWRNSNEPFLAPRYQSVTRPAGPPDRVTGKVRGMIRHVVVFTWSEAAGEERRAAAVQALRRLRQDVGGMTSLVVAEDAGLSDGNADTVLIADFPDVQAFYRYAQDPVHIAVLAEHVRPWLAARSAVQYQV